MRILVVGSCGNRKLYSSITQPKCHEIDSQRDITYWKQRFPSLCASARSMYTGPQSTELVKAVDILRTIPTTEVQLVIVSAGFGLLKEDDLVPPYDCSFTSMKIAQVRERSNELGIRSSFNQVLENPFDLIYLALGKRYQIALGTDVFSTTETTTVLFHNLESDKSVRIPCAAAAVKAFSKSRHRIHGVVGFKGDLLRILALYAKSRRSPENELNKWRNPTYLKKLIHCLGGLKQAKG